MLVSNPTISETPRGEPRLGLVYKIALQDHLSRLRLDVRPARLWEIFVQIRLERLRRQYS